MLATFLGLVIFGFWVAHEAHIRRLAKVEPATVRAIFRSLQKATTPDRRYSAMGFAAASLVCFAAWEGMIRGMLQFPTHLLAWLGGAAAFTAAFLLRRRSPARLHREEVWLGLAGLVLWAQAWWTLLLLGLWVFWRSFFLPSLFPLSRRSFP